MIFRPTLLITLALLILCGCSQYKINRLREHSPVTEAPPTAEKLPELTPRELERMGDLYLERRDYQTAYMKYDQAHHLAPDDLSLRYKMGLALLLGNAPKEALKEFQVVLKSNPGHAPAYEAVGRAYLQMKDYKNAEKNLRKAIEINPELWRSHNYLGIIHDYRKRYDAAIIEYQTALKHNPVDGTLYNNLGVSYLLSKNYDAAIKDFRNALKNGYAVPKVYNNLGMALSKKGEYEAALNAFIKGNGEAGGYNNLGCVYLEMGKYDKAVESFEKALALSPCYYRRAAENLKIVR
jgi:tetratricopeptide (TPR) repeat protein